MEASSVPLKAKKYRLGHSRAGDLTIDVYIHFQMGGDDDIACRLVSVLSKEVLNYMPLPSPKQKGVPGELTKPLNVNENLVAGVGFEATTFGL